MLRIYQIETSKDRKYVRELFWEYLQWANAELNRHFGINFDIEEMLNEDMQKLDKFLPPNGCLLLASQNDEVVGLGCLKKLKDDIGEIKRMYVKSKYRKKGIGKAILQQLLVEAGEVGYARVWLDSARFMKAAHAMYRSQGFQEIEPYPESEIPAEFQQNWIFMEKWL
jgi:ribosomal protein S18 acetylase RimI-like enzyme